MAQAWDLLAAVLIIFGAWRLVMGDLVSNYRTLGGCLGLLWIVVGFVIVALN
jgi:hypothetical protein